MRKKDADGKNKGRVKKKRDSFQSKLCDFIKKTTEQVTGKKTSKDSSCRGVFMPQAVLHLCGDKNVALFLSQLIYWADKGGRADGFVFKVYEEWRTETGLSRRQIMQTTQRLEEAGLLETKLRKADWFPTKHYKLNRELLVKSLHEFLTKGVSIFSFEKKGVPNEKKAVPNEKNHNIKYTRQYPTKTTSGFENRKPETVSLSLTECDRKSAPSLCSKNVSPTGAASFTNVHRGHVKKLWERLRKEHPDLGLYRNFSSEEWGMLKTGLIPYCRDSKFDVLKLIRFAVENWKFCCHEIVWDETAKNPKAKIMEKPNVRDICFKTREFIHAYAKFYEQKEDEERKQQANKALRQQYEKEQRRKEQENQRKKQESEKRLREIFGEPIEMEVVASKKFSPTDLDKL